MPASPFSSIGATFGSGALATYAGCSGQSSPRTAGSWPRAVGEADPQGIQRLLYAARWDADGVLDELIRLVAESFGDTGGIFVVDETGFLKKGTKSVRVQRQDTGKAGKTENCQVGVFLSYVGPQGHAFLDRRLYLAQGWADDAMRRAEAAVSPNTRAARRVHYWPAPFELPSISPGPGSSAR